MIDVVSVEQAGDILGCSRSRVFELLSAGVLERAPRFGRSLRIYRASVDKALIEGPGRGGPKRKPRTALPERVDREALRVMLQTEGL